MVRCLSSPALLAVSASPTRFSRSHLHSRHRSSPTPCLPQASSSARAAAGTAAASLPALREGPLDALRENGATSFRETALALHPVQAVQAQQLANEWDTSLRLAAMAHGQAAAMQRRLDRAALSQIRRLPGGAPSSHALLDAYLGRDGRVGVEDVLNDPELRALGAASGDLSDPK